LKHIINYFDKLCMILASISSAQVNPTELMIWIKWLVPCQVSECRFGIWSERWALPGHACLGHCNCCPSPPTPPARARASAQSAVSATPWSHNA